MENTKEIFGIFFITWVVLGIFGWVFFVFYKDISVKRKILPVWLVFIGILFVFFMYLLGANYQMFLMMVPAIILITALNIYSIRFCDSCGKVYNKFPFQGIKYCAKCGAKLTS